MNYKSRNVVSKGPSRSEIAGALSSPVIGASYIARSCLEWVLNRIDREELERRISPPLNLTQEEEAIKELLNSPDINGIRIRI